MDLRGILYKNLLKIQVRGKGLPVTFDAKRGLQIQLCLFLASSLDGGGCQAPFCQLTFHGTHYQVGCLGLANSLGRYGEKKISNPETSRRGQSLYRLQYPIYFFFNLTSLHTCKQISCMLVYDHQ